MSKPKPCYDVDEVISLTGLEQSTLQFYDQLFGDLLPARIQRADRALFQGQTIDLLRSIHRWYDQQEMSVEEIRQLILLEQQSHFRQKPQQTARIVGVTSGKGGVGKSNIALNMALEIHRRGYRTVLLDGDLGTANLHILSGVTPAKTLFDVTHGTADISDVLTEGPQGLSLIAGGSGVCQLANLPRHRRFHLISQLEKLENCVDVIIIDTAPGIAGNVTDFLRVADLNLLIATPDLTAVTDVYALIKTLFSEWANFTGSLAMVSNMVRSGRQGGNIHQRLSGCVRRFLDRPLEYAGHVPKDTAVSRAGERRQPFLLGEPGCRASRAIQKIVDYLKEAVLDREKKESSISTLWECPEKWEQPTGSDRLEQALVKPTGTEKTAIRRS